MSFAPRLGAPSTGVILTGGASGLGRASAEALAAVGRPVSIWDLDAEKSAAVAKEIADQYGVIAQGLAVDVRDPEALARGADAAREALPNIGAFVHAAGIVDTGSIDGVTPENWDDGMAIHLRPVALLTRILLPDLAAQEGSAIVDATWNVDTVGAGSSNSTLASSRIGTVSSMATAVGDTTKPDSASPGAANATIDPISVTAVITPTSDATCVDTVGS